MVLCFATKRHDSWLGLVMVLCFATKRHDSCAHLERVWKVAGGARREVQSADGTASEFGCSGNEEVGSGQRLAEPRHPGGNIERQQTLHGDSMVTAFKLQCSGKVVQVCLQQRYQMAGADLFIHGLFIALCAVAQGHLRAFH